MSTAADTGVEHGHPALDVRHETFTMTRRFEAPPSAVYAAFADDRVRRRWVRMPGSGAAYRHDFRVGGGEEATSTFAVPDGAPERLASTSRYLDLVTDRRIVYAYESVVDDVPRWASLVTVLLDAVLLDGGGDRCVLSWTEQVAFLARSGDGSADLPHLRGATALRLNGLAAALTPEA